MTTNPICVGCYIHPDFLYNRSNRWRPYVSDICVGCYVQDELLNYDPVVITNKPSQSLTTKEKIILHNLKEAWSGFSKIADVSEQQKQEFLQAIHAAQTLVALQVARRVDPEVWV